MLDFIYCAEKKKNFLRQILFEIIVFNWRHRNLYYHYSTDNFVCTLLTCDYASMNARILYIDVSRFNYQSYVFVYHLLGVVCVNVCLVHHDCTSIIAFQQYSYIHWSLRQQVKFLAMNNWAILTTWFSLREYDTNNKHAV